MSHRTNRTSPVRMYGNLPREDLRSDVWRRNETNGGLPLLYLLTSITTRMITLTQENPLA